MVASKDYFSLYFHIPFCLKKCSYCDFVSYVGKEKLINRYVEVLLEEMDGMSGLGQGGKLKTIYFGGGTPTLLQVKHFERIFAATVKCFASNLEDLEITAEANPGTADKAKLKALKELGVNRLSIGVQSFNNRHLKNLGRIHSSSEIFRICEDACTAGFENVNLDLIFALPGQTLEEWQKDLCLALSLKPRHISTYNLQLEENTPLWKRRKFLQFPSEEEELAMYEYAIETLTAAGYRHYEISNFAHPGYECQHNLNYWKNGNYLGLGAGAHSHWDGKRWANTDTLESYLRMADGEGRKRENLTDVAGRETIMLGLRLLEGLPEEKFKGFEREVEELISDQLLARENGYLRLTRKGLYLGNLVFEKFV